MFCGPERLFGDCCRRRIRERRFAARPDFVQSARTNAYTGPAGGAFVGVDFRQSGLRIHFNGAEGAVANAVTQTQTAVGTAGFADKGAIGKPAALQADVFDFVGSVFASAVAMQNRNRRFMFGGRIAEPCGNSGHHFGTADRTVKAGERFGVGSGAGVGEILTARFAAGTAVGLRQHCCNFVGDRIAFGLKFWAAKYNMIAAATAIDDKTIMLATITSLINQSLAFVYNALFIAQIRGMQNVFFQLSQFNFYLRLETTTEQIQKGVIERQYGKSCGCRRRFAAAEGEKCGQDRQHQKQGQNICPRAAVSAFSTEISRVTFWPVR